jgi:hypothetical protein
MTADVRYHLPKSFCIFLILKNRILKIIKIKYNPE